MIQDVTGFDWDQGNLLECQKHGVEIAEIEALFQQEMAVFPDLSNSKGEDRFIGIGKGEKGRHVFVAFYFTHGQQSCFDSSHQCALHARKRG